MAGCVEVVEVVVIAEAGKADNSLGGSVKVVEVISDAGKTDDS